jgi:hypothetical protein
MPLVQCPDCGKEHSDAAPACPHCGRPTGAASPGRTTPQTVYVKKKTSPAAWGCLTVIVVGVLGGIISSLSDSTERRGVSEGRTGTISYSIVQEWRIPAGGYGRVIVIHPRHRNEVDMRKLGNELREEHRRDRIANIEIYDDRRAAALRQEALLSDDRGSPDVAHHDQHRIGIYSKNVNTGHHQLQIALEGFMADPDGWITVEYLAR